jgi:hypothetical protein
MRRAAKSRMTSSPEAPSNGGGKDDVNGCTAGQAEHEVGPPQLKASCDGAAHQDGQGDRRSTQGPT